MAEEAKKPGGVLGFLRKAAPFIGAGLSVAGPVGNLAAGMLNKVVGGDPANNTPEGVLKALGEVAMTPEQVVELQKLEQDFKLQMATMNIKTVTDLESIAAADRDSARNREIQVRDKTPRNLAYIYAAMFFVTLITEILMAIYCPNLNQLAVKSVDILLGVLTGMVLGTKEYYFGSSAGSAQKTELLAKSPSITSPQ